MYMTSIIRKFILWLVLIMCLENGYISKFPDYKTNLSKFLDFKTNLSGIITQKYIWHAILIFNVGWEIN